MLTAMISSLIYALPISIICAAQLFPLFCPEDTSFGPVIISLVFLAVFAVFRHGSLKIRLVMIAATVATSTGIFFAVDKEERLEFFSERLWVALVFLISLSAYAAGELLSTFRTLRFVAAGASIAVIVYLIIIGSDPGALTSTMLFTIILITVTREVQQYWKKEGDTDGRRHMVSIIPFLILIAFFVAASPSSEDPYGWPVSKRIWQFMKDTATRIGQYFASDDEDYMDLTIGFSSSNAGLNGKIEDGSDSEEMFSVSFTRKNTPSLNLGACGYNEFNGNAWTNTVDDSGIGRRYILDGFESRGSLIISGVKTLSDHMRSINVSVTYSNLNTRYALLPGKYDYALSHGALLSSNPDNDNIVFGEKKGIGTTYDFSAITLNKNHKDFIDFMSHTGAPLSSEVWEETVTDLFLKSKRDYPYEEYLSYIEKIRKNYCRPVMISPELRGKLDALYEGSSCVYEKMLRAEALLSQFRYTLDPGPLPETIDSPEAFLDWFMLDNPAGYCSHFATAMVLLARAEGLPARYVEGFCVSPSTTGGTTVNNHNAHSWAEIYFEGFGFICFDGTPGYASDSVWQTAAERAAYLATLSKGSIDAFTTDWVNTPVSEEPGEEDIPDEDSSPALIIIPVIMCLLLLPAAVLLYKGIAGRRFKKLSLEDKAVSLCHANMRLLRFLGSKPAPGETLSEFTKQSKEKIPTELMDFITLYEEISYSGKEISPDMLSSLMRSNESLSAYAAKERRIAYFFYSYINL
ncbi:MAG: transglutaminase family protein [Lachnospiraceae bacterium]|nr:transglutaminase family protein [Lachnospiraceae bacterium]